MSLKQLLDRISQAKQQMVANRESEALRIAFDQVALLKLRIQSRGENAQDAPFEPYTPVYAETRKSKGYQIEFVDFTRTGRMWANIGPEVTSSNVFRAVVDIGGRDEKTRAMLRGHANKRGNILAPTQAELSIIRAANRERILKYFQF